MSKAVKIWLITAAALILVGCVAFVAGMAAMKWDFTKLSTDKYEINKYEINEDFNSISVRTDIHDIIFVRSESSECMIECYEMENVKHSVSVNEGTIEIKVTDTRKWYERIGILNFQAPKLTVYLPESEYISLIIEGKTGDVEIPKDFNFETVDISVITGDVKCYASVLKTAKIRSATVAIGMSDVSVGTLELSVNTGKVSVSGVTCEGDIRIDVSTGKAELSDIRCQSVISTGDTGSLLLRDVIASERLFIDRSTGKVKLEGSDAEEIFIKTDTGDVEGYVLTDKVFIVKTDTGDVEVPNSITGGRCEITTDTGDIRITVCGN